MISLNFLKTQQNKREACWVDFSVSVKTMNKLIKHNCSALLELLQLISRKKK